MSVVQFAVLFLIIIVLTLFVVHLLLRNQKLEKTATRSTRDRRAVVNFLNRFANSVSSVNDIDSSIVSLGRYITEAIHAESLCIFFMDKSGKKLHAVTQLGDFPHLDAFNLKEQNSDLLKYQNIRDKVIDLNKGFLGKAAGKLETLFIGDTTIDARVKDHIATDKIETLMVCPISIDGELQGMIAAVNSTDGYPFEAADLLLLKSLSGHASLARNMIEAYHKQGEQQRINQELEFAKKIQVSLMPESIPQIGDIKVYAENRPAKEVSGDFFDYIDIDEHKTLVVIADASGKGIPACMIMNMTRSVLRSLCTSFTSLEDLLLQLNDNIFKDIDNSRFITMAFCLIDKRDNVVECARAGHTELLFRNPEGSIQKLLPDGPAIGLLPNMLGLSFETFSFIFQPGATMFFFTDGLTEAANINDEEYGLDRLIAAWNNSPNELKSSAEYILNDVNSFAEDMPQADDQTVVLITMEKEEKIEQAG